MKLFVWDFHGVLEQGNDKAVIYISNAVLRAAGHAARFTMSDSKRLYGLKWHEYFTTLLPEISAKESMALQAACFNYAENNIDVIRKHIRPSPHAKRMLASIVKAGHDQIVISNTRPSDLIWFLDAVGMREYFPEGKALGVNSHEHFSDKISALTHYLHSKSYTHIVIVSDSLSDMSLKDVAGGITYLYSPGKSVSLTGEKLVDHHISSLAQLLKEL